MSNELKFRGTKGIWEAKGLYIQSKGKVSDIGQSFVKIEWEHGKVKVDHEAYANSKIMAASPELLEALQDGVELMEYLINATHTGKVREILCDWNIIAHAAINKALSYEEAGA